MPTFVSQDQISSCTPRALQRTTYLQPLRTTVIEALRRYHERNPTGTEFTLAAFSAVGQSELEKLSRKSGHDFKTVKKDFGLLVAQALVEEFGPTRVQTYRSDDGSSASQRVSGWPQLEPWVGSYAPHRVVMSGERIVLDTVVVREGTLDVERLLRVKGDHPVSLADGAVAELLYWMTDSKARRPAFPGWPERAALYTKLLDPDMPIAPGGHEMAALAGLRPFQPGFSPENFREYSRAVWRYLAGLRGPADITRPPVFQIAGKKMTFSIRPASPALKAAGDRWAALAQKMGEKLRATKGKEKVTEASLSELFRANLAAAGDIAHVDRLDLMIRALARRAHEAAYLGYSPKPGESNAALDFALLFAIPLPAVVCTSDGRLVRFIRGLNSPDRGKVMEPEELLVWLATGKSPA